MTNDTEGDAQRKGLIRLLWLIGLSGGLLIALVYALVQSLPENLVHLGRDLGIALIVAAILGRLVDSALKKDLVRDAVSAAIGYLLPDSLKAELNWIYDQKFITEQTYSIRLEHRPADKLVVFNGHYTRIVRNNSGEKARPNIGGGIDEWFHLLGESQITTCCVTRQGKSTEIRPERNETGIGYNCDNIELEPQESIKVDMAYSLIVAESGLEILTHCYPIEDPLVILDIPNTLMARVTFSHRSVSYNVGTLESGHISRRLNGILLPYTDIRIFWYLASGVESRRKELKSEVRKE